MWRLGVEVAAAAPSGAGGPTRRVRGARAELEERVLELQLLGDAGIDELLHDGFAEALQLRVLESAGESLDARDAQFLAERDGLPVEHLDSDFGELLPDDVLLPRLVV